MATTFVPLVSHRSFSRSVLRAQGPWRSVNSSMASQPILPRTSFLTSYCVRHNSNSTQASKAGSAQTTEHHGSCHCAAVKITFTTTKSPAELGARQCQCAFCKVSGGSHTSDPDGKLSIKAAPGAITPYRFGTSTADFLLCSTCGNYPAITWRRDDGKLVGVVRIQALESRDDFLKHEKQMHVNEEPWEDRLARRSRTWMPAVIEE